MSEHTEIKRRSSSRDRSQLWTFFALIIYAPLPLASDRIWALALLGMFTAALLIWNVWKPEGRNAAAILNAMRVPAACLLLWLGLLCCQLLPVGYGAADSFAGSTISVDVYSTRMYLAKACILAALLWLAARLISSHRRMELLARVIVFSGLFQAMLGVILMATGTTFELFFVPMKDAFAHGTFVYHNHLAGYLELALAAGIGLMIAKLDGRATLNWRQRLHGWLALLFSEKVILRVSLIIMVIGLVATRSRMGNSAFFASLLIVGSLTVILSKYRARSLTDKRTIELTRSMIVFITSLIVLDVIIIGGVVGIEKVVQRIGNTNLETQSVEVSQTRALTPEESLEQRSRAARAAVGLVEAYPLLGTGGGTFHLAFLSRQPQEVQAFVDHAHNDYVEFASETGLAGLLMMASLVLHSMMSSLKLLKSSSDQMVRGMVFGSLMGVVSLLIHASVDFNFQNPAVAMLFLILLSFPYLLTGLARAGFQVQSH